MIGNLETAAGVPMINVTSLPIEPTGAAAAGTLSGNISVSGSAVINVFFETTKAYVGQSAQVNQHSTGNADQSVSLLAGDKLTILDGAGGLAGGGDTGIGLGPPGRRRHLP